MPIEVTKYTCKFKCRARAVSEKKSMEFHENRCWNNPDNKTCKTCKNEIVETDSDDFRSWTVRTCKLTVLADFFDTFHERLKPHQASIQVRPIYNCQYHNKEKDENIDEFVGDLFREFGSNEAGTIHFPYYIPPVSEHKTNKVEDLPF